MPPSQDLPIEHYNVATDLGRIKIILTSDLVENQVAFSDSL